MMLIPMMRFGTDSALSDIDDRTGVRAHMMGWAQTNPTIFWLHAGLKLTVTLLAIAVLFALLRFLWKKGNK